MILHVNLLKYQKKYKMKLLSIGTDRKIFEQGSYVNIRQSEYGNLFEEVNIIVFSHESHGFRDMIQISKNVFAYPTNSKTKLLYLWDAYRLASKKISKDKNNFVLSTQDPFETGFIGVCLKLLLNIPLHIQIHTDFANKYFIKHSFLNTLRVIIGNITIPYADNLRVVSKRIKTSISDLNLNVDVLPIMNNSWQDFDSKINKSNKNIITVSRLEKEKDVGTLITAFKKVVDVFSDTRLIIVGDGGDRKRLEDMVSFLNIKEKVVFTGWKENIIDVYKDSCIYVSTSLYEGYGMSIVEGALSYNALVISDTGIAGEVFVDNESALVCKQGNSNAFADAIIRLLKDDDFRINMCNKAYEVAKKHLLSKDQYLKSYKENIEKTKSLFKSKEYFLTRIFVFLLAIINNNKLIRFIIAGGFVALTQIYVLYILTDIFLIWYLYSSMLSFVYACVSSFFLQKFWAFKDYEKKNALAQFVKFVIVAVIGISINTTFMYLLVDLIGLWYVFSQFVTGIIVAIINFLIYKFFIFKT